jgi:MFS family permease
MREITSSAANAGTLQGRLQRTLRRLIVEPPPLAYFTRQHWYPWLIVGLVSVGAFIGQLDATIVQLALPTLGKTFDASLEAVSWVSLAYLVAFASCLPIFGRLCEMFGRKSLYLIGYTLFTVASTLCALASDLTWLIVFRVLQGIGGSLLGANSISILVKAVDQDRRGRALGFFAAAQAIGMSAGPIAEADPTASRQVGTAAFALFGAGLGVFIAPTNHATLKAAPASLSGEAGSMLNLMRVLGTSLGVASASSTLAWRLETVTGSHHSWIPFAGRPLLGAVESSLAMLAIMAVAAAAVSLIRTRRRPAP